MLWNSVESEEYYSQKNLLKQAHCFIIYYFRIHKGLGIDNSFCVGYVLRKTQMTFWTLQAYALIPMFIEIFRPSYVEFQRSHDDNIRGKVKSLYSDLKKKLKVFFMVGN